jgi:uncharacterized phage-associated protein
MKHKPYLTQLKVSTIKNVVYLLGIQNLKELHLHLNMTNNKKNITVFNIEKIGNLFNYLSSNIDNLFFTKLLKLTYIIDEYSVKESGSPVTWLNYRVWKNGPVPQKVHTNITFEQGSQFSKYINISKVEKINGLKITPNSTFDDSEFSEYEMELIDRVIQEFGHFNSNELIEILHQQNTIWHRIVKERNLQVIFDSDTETNTSPYEIDLKEAINDPFLKSMYDEMKDSISFRKKLELA